MNLAVTIGGLACSAAGALVFFVARSAGAALRAYQKTRIADLADMPDGATVQLHATVACDEPLDDPSSRKPVIYFYVSVSESSGRAQDRDARHAALHRTVERVPRWSLQDETGSVAVECADFSVEGGRSGSEDRVLSYYALSGSQYFASSSHIAVGQKVFVEARLERRGDEVVLTGPGMTVDGHTEKNRGNLVGLFYALAAALFVVGLLGAASGLVAPDAAPEPQIREGPISPFPPRAPAHRHP